MKSMKEFAYHSGIKLRIYPSRKQKTLIFRNANAARYIYNKMVALGNERYLLRRTAALCPADAARLDYIESVFGSATGISNIAPFLNEPGIDAQAKANAIQNYKKAWKNFRDTPGAGVPTFHRRKTEFSYQTNPHYNKTGADDMNNANARFEDMYHMVLPILGRIRVKGSPVRVRRLFAMSQYVRIGTITVSCDASGRYFVSLQLASDVPFFGPLPKTGASRGYDLNLDNFYTDSDGNVVDNPRFLKDKLAKLQKAQRKLSRMTERAKKEKRDLKECKNYQKQKAKVAKLHMQVRLTRLEFQQVLSKREVESQDLLSFENLPVRNLIKNHKLARAISDVSWSQFVSLCEAKARAYGKQFVKVDPKHTTQMCSTCGYILNGEDKLTLNDRFWTCPACGTFHVRDENAAKNILAKGALSLLA